MISIETVEVSARKGFGLGLSQAAAPGSASASVVNSTLHVQSAGPSAGRAHLSVLRVWFDANAAAHRRPVALVAIAELAGTNAAAERLFARAVASLSVEGSEEREEGVAPDRCRPS